MDRLEYERYLMREGKTYRRPRPKLIRIPEDHPYYSMAHRGYVAESRLKMAEHLGRALTTDELVYFKDDFPLNTNIENLELKNKKDLRQNMIEYGAIDTKSERYLKGKEEEKRIATHLASIGYEVIDISLDKIYRPDGSSYYSPFDILAKSKNFTFLADVKYRSSRGPIYFDIYQLEFYQKYIPIIEVDDRLIIVSTPGLTDIFASIYDIKNSYVTTEIGACVIERDRAHPITLLRKRLEGATNT